MLTKRSGPRLEDVRFDYPIMFYRTTSGEGYNLCWRVVAHKAWFVIVRESDGAVTLRQPAPRVMPAEFFPGHSYEVIMSFLKRHAETNAKSVAAGSKEGESFQKKFPALVEYLTATEFPDKTERTTSTLLWFWDSGVYKVCLNDRHAGMSLWASGGTLLDALHALESLLASGEGEWRSSGQKTPSKRQKRS